MKQLACKSNEGDADSGYIPTMEDGSEESRSGVDSHLSLFLALKRISHKPLVSNCCSWCMVMGVCGVITQSVNVEEVRGAGKRRADATITA